MNKSVLIIEDEPELCALLKKYLTKRKFNVTCAENLKLAMELLKYFSYDAVILDNNLPDGKGIDVIPAINYTQHNPIIIAMSAMQIKEEALIAGASYFIEKPISMADVNRLLNL